MTSRTVILLLSVIALLGSPGNCQTGKVSTVPLQERIYVASRVYATIHTYFDGWRGTESSDFEPRYQGYLQSILRGSDDRRTFDLETMKFVALLHNGHTWFNDRWLEQKYGSPLGFYAEPVEGQWVVTDSDLPSLQIGDVIARVGGIPTEEFFQQNRQFLADSSERSQRTDLFSQPYLFPQQFALTLADGRTVSITRSLDETRTSPGAQINGHWLEPDRFAYIRIPSFSGGVVAVSAAIGLVRKFKDAHGLVIDVRGNLGGAADPRELQVVLMDRSFRSWRESRGRFASPTGNRTELVSEGEEARPYPDTESGSYTGPLVILIDEACASTCENFVMPFKDNHRATLIGQTTYGSYADTYFLVFDNGMMLNTAATRVTFPDGSPFEGVGISPDIAVERTVSDIRARNDVALKRALEFLQNRQR